LYKNYPPAKVAKGSTEDEEDEEGKKKSALISKKKEEAKKKEEEEKKEGEEIDPKDDRVSFKPLFHFECDVTEGRQVSCMDINELNPDLIAVGYGEYDINCVDDSKLKQGLLCFWTLKNPNFPEKIITHEHSITACQFSKKNPNLIAIGDSHGNIAIYNIRGNDTKPIAESKDMDSKHTDIVWEIQWMQRENKSESLISISGDGRIIEWSMKKGLEFNELMQLKRETNPN
jgi:dynein intermediate chain 4, axonemal